MTTSAVLVPHSLAWARAWRLRFLLSFLKATLRCFWLWKDRIKKNTKSSLEITLLTLNVILKETYLKAGADICKAGAAIAVRER